MANLNEIDDWVEVYQIETTDPVLGGPPSEATGAGMANIPASQLTKRTRWLKTRVDALVAAVVDATTAVKGIVQLSNSLTSTSTTMAATPSAVKAVNDAVNLRALSSRTITAGGLATGGGDLSVNRVITVPVATQAVAEAGTDDTVAMSPLKTAQAIAARLLGRSVLTSGLATGGGNLSADRTINVPVATQAQAEAGTDNATAMTPLRVTQRLAQPVTLGPVTADWISQGAPAIKSADFALVTKENVFQIAKAGSDSIVTLPDPATMVGRQIVLTNRGTTSVVSSAANVMAHREAVVSAAILPPVPGAWCRLAAGAVWWHIIESGIAAPDVATLRASLSLGTSDLATFGALSLGAPIIRSADFSVGDTENVYQIGKVGSPCIVTLPAIPGPRGRQILLVNRGGATTVVSASVNVGQQNAVTVSNALLPAISGAWCRLCAGDVSWHIVASGFAVPDAPTGRAALGFDAPGTAPVYASRGYGRMSGTTGATTFGLNVSSTTRSGVGTYSVAWATAAPSQNYLPIVFTTSGNVTVTIGNVTASGFDFTCRNAGGTLIDPAAIIFGMIGG